VLTVKNFKTLLHLFFLGVWGRTWIWAQCFIPIRQALCYLNHTFSHFALIIFGDGVLWTICQGQPQIMILPSQSPTQVSRIIGVSHRYSANNLTSYMKWIHQPLTFNQYAITACSHVAHLQSEKVFVLFTSSSFYWHLLLSKA
jgi:hypothetical protein